MNKRTENQGWRQGHWAERQLSEGNNPHSVVVHRQYNLDYWNCNGEYGAGSLVYYDIRVQRAYRKAGRAYPWHSTTSSGGQE